MMMGLPKLLTTDQGSEFKNSLNAELMKNLGIKHHLVTPYHPQVCVNVQLHLTSTFIFDLLIFFSFKANGLDERFNQTLQRMLVKYLNSEHKDEWDEFLETCVFAYNTSRVLGKVSFLHSYVFHL